MDKGKCTGNLQTHVTDVDRALETLSHSEMIALSSMYERWALTELKITPEQRTMLVQWSSDYERIAAFAGPTWEASAPEDGTDAIAFVARLELRSTGVQKSKAAVNP